MFVIASPAVLGRLSIVFRQQWDYTSYFEKLAAESTEGTTLASCVEWEYNVLAVRIVFISFMSDGSWRLLVGLGRSILATSILFWTDCFGSNLPTGTRGMTPPTSRSWLVAPSPVILQCVGEMELTRGVFVAIVVEPRRRGTFRFRSWRCSRDFSA